MYITYRTVEVASENGDTINKNVVDTRDSKFGLWKFTRIGWPFLMACPYEPPSIYIYIWAIVKTLGSRKGHPQIWEGPIAYHTFVQ